MRRVYAIFFIIVLQVTAILMPYNNFNDTLIYKIYSDFQNQDPDMNLGEFVFDKLLIIGRVIENEDEEDGSEKGSNCPRFPSEALPSHIQPGTIILNSDQFATQKNTFESEKPVCYFRENKYSFNYLSSVFHPPLYSF